MHRSSQHRIISDLDANLAFDVDKENLVGVAKRNEAIAGRSDANLVDKRRERNERHLATAYFQHGCVR